jgi:Flp pilus assembly protein TadD
VFAATALLVIVPQIGADNRCLPCHRAQVESYARTGMAQSAGSPAGQPGGRLRHEGSGLEVVIRSSQERMTHGIADDEYDVPFYIGSGRVGRSYLTQIGNALFQSPASWFASLRQWRMSPGFEADAAPEFYRPVTPDCLFCHASGVQHVSGSINRYGDPPFAGGINCDRCHGDPRPHVRAPSRRNIINPVRLRPRARDSVCESCHLSGEARIVNPGWRFSDFRPGMELEQVFAVYVAQQPQFNVVSHVEQLAASRCAKESGSQLWCGTCHDPHREPADGVTWYRNKCLSCHADAHHQPAGDCVACHMPKRPVHDVAHTAFTDHRIARRPTAASAASSVLTRLSEWQPAAEQIRNRNLGLAYVAAGEKHESALLLQEGFRLLTSEALDNDASVLTSIGQVLLRKQQPQEAARFFLRAAKLEPNDPRHHLNAAAAFSAMKQGEASALTAADRAIALDPLLKDAYILAAEIHRRRGDIAKASATMQSYRAQWDNRSSLRLRLKPSLR